jgi:hypothetical protein
LLPIETQETYAEIKNGQQESAARGYCPTDLKTKLPNLSEKFQESFVSEIIES